LKSRACAQRFLVGSDGRVQVRHLPQGLEAPDQRHAQVGLPAGPVGEALRGGGDGLVPQVCRCVQIFQVPGRFVATQVGASSVVPGGQAEAFVCLGKGGVVQYPLPGGHGPVQRRQVAGLKIALEPGLGLAEISQELFGDGGAAVCCIGSFSKGPFHAHLAAAAQQGAVGLYRLACPFRFLRISQLA